MPRFFVDPSDIYEHTIQIRGAEKDHILKALRMQKGEAIEVTCGDGLVYMGTIADWDSYSISITYNQKVPCQSEPDVEVTMYSAFPKGDKAEFIVQKAVELGAKRIVFFLSSRCIARPDPQNAQRKIERISKIAFEAAKQSERGQIPKVNGILEYHTMLQSLKENEKHLFLFERGGIALRTAMQQKPCHNISIISGPEGGFSAEEVEQAAAAGCILTSLGKRILRCETAPMCALIAVMYETGNL